MRLLRRLFSTGRSLAAVLLLSAFAAGSVADARHHLSEKGCPADHGGREDHCVCSSLHAAPFASEAEPQPAPVEQEREFIVVACVSAPHARPVRGESPRAPPRG